MNAGMATCDPLNRGVSKPGRPLQVGQGTRAILFQVLGYDALSFLVAHRLRGRPVRAQVREQHLRRGHLQLPDPFPGQPDQIADLLQRLAAKSQ